METKVNEKKLNNFVSKFKNIAFNSDNYLVGGGLSGGMSRRNENAKFDEGKLTIDQASKKIADIFNVEKSFVKELFEEDYKLEWHHAGFLPKSYGGGMRKIYYVNSEQMLDLVEKFNQKITKHNELIEAQKKSNIAKAEKAKQIEKFIKKYGTKFYRERQQPKFAFVELTEMEGKYGWFDSSLKSYNLPEYYTGVAFKSQKKLSEYTKLTYS